MRNNVRSNMVQAAKNSANIICALGLFAQLAGCAPNGDLAEANKKLDLANQKIAELEAQLASVKAGASAAGASQAAESAPPAAALAASSAPIEQPAAVTLNSPQWRYDVAEQQMTGGKRTTATVDSTNTVDFGFPYNGSQNARLTLRTDPQYGKDVIFGLEKGQILCSSYEGCAVQVRFDEEKPVNFAATAAADHSSNIVFIDDYPRFLAKMRKAKRVRLSVNIYQQGRPVFEFDVSGFNFDRYQAKQG